MKKQILGAAACAFLLMGCTENESIERGLSASNDGKMRFGATTGHVTRAERANPFSNTKWLQMHATFYVVGFDGSNEYVGKTDAPQEVNWWGTSWEYANEPYWPNTPVTFYAYANWEDTDSFLNIRYDGIQGYTKVGQDTDRNAQKDLLVAAVKSSKEERTTLTFKHALTQVVFKAGTVNPAIEVEIGGITLVNIAQEANMSYSLEGSNSGEIVWHNQGMPQAAYVVNYIKDVAGSGFKVPDLSKNPTKYAFYPQVQSKEYRMEDLYDNSLLLIPQEFNAWQPSNNRSATALNQTGAYIQIKAIIKKAESDDTSHYYCGTPGGAPGLVDDTYGTIYIPVSSLASQLGEWKPGKRVNYILTFGDTNSGSGGGGYDENGNPILVPIRFTTEVENWIESDAPLLTVTFETNSDAVDGPFIASYVHQLLNDVKAASVPKLYNGKVTAKGELLYNGTNLEILTGVDFTNEINNQFLQGSTIEFDFTRITNWSGKELTLTVPNGWDSNTSREDSVITINKTAPIVSIYRTVTPN